MNDVKKASLQTSTHANQTKWRHEGRNSSVGNATRYWLDGLRFENSWVRDFLRTSIKAPRPSHTSLQ
jgi:hypothetical protein